MENNLTIKSHWLRRQMWACLPVRVSAKVVLRTTL